jgi:holliday junction DNA helicase RuvA
LGEPGGEVTLRIHTHATENRVALYGFATAEERKVFDFLITVKNVGPSTAMSILSGATSAAALVRTIAAGDVAGLVRLKGVGKKTAELLVVELKEKCEWLLATWGAAGAALPAAEPKRGARPAILDDVASALVHLGWRAAEADKVLSKLEIPPGASVEMLLRDAIRAMPR